MAKERIFKINKCKRCHKKNVDFACYACTANIILLDCKAFYKLFCNLEKYIFNSSAQYEEDVSLYSIPAVVNGALAAELAIKFLILRDGSGFELTHNLENLFNALPKQDKKLISEKIITVSAQNNKTLNENIHRISNIFNEYRYFFQEDHVGCTNFFCEFVNIVCNYALSLEENR